MVSLHLHQFFMTQPHPHWRCKSPGGQGWDKEGRGGRGLGLVLRYCFLPLTPMAWTWVAGRGGSETRVGAPPPAGPQISHLRGCSFSPNLTHSPRAQVDEPLPPRSLWAAPGDPLDAFPKSQDPHHLLWPKTPPHSFMLLPFMLLSNLL